MKQLTKKQAVAFAEEELYKEMSYEQRAKFQIEQEFLCMPFDVFHEAIEKTLGRPVYTHEFACNVEGLRKELNGESEPPTFEEIVNMIPAEKRVLIFV